MTEAYDAEDLALKTGDDCHTNRSRSNWALPRLGLELDRQFAMGRPLAVGYGGLDRGLLLLRGEQWMPIAFAAFFGSASGSWVGGIVGSVTLGLFDYRRPVLVSSLIGGAADRIHAAAAGALVEWTVGQEVPQSMLGIQLASGLGVPLGGAAGWLVGWSLSRGFYE